MPAVPKDIRDRATRLRASIEYHNFRYHTLDSPEIGDEEFDALFNELRQLEEKYPGLVRPSSPTQRLGGRTSRKFAEVSHSVPMLSLNNAFSEDDVRAFDQRVRDLLEGVKCTYSAEPKFDGLAVSLLYRDGVFVQGATRGDGTTGEDVTENLRRVYGVPHQLPSHLAMDELLVRGEVIVYKADFEALNSRQRELGRKEFLNPRNLAAGSLRLLDSEVVAERRLRFVAYAVGTASDVRWRTHSELLQALSNLDFPIPDRTAIASDIHALLQFYRDIAQARQELPYAIDGVVYKVNEIELQQRLGYVSRAPRFAIAHKFAAEEVVTVVEQIDVQVGRTGVLTPVARLRPVLVGGAKVENATLHNEEDLRRKQIWVGDSVVIRRAGDVIPEIVRVATPGSRLSANEFQMPLRCPECNSKVSRLPGESAWRCTGGLTCPAQLKQSLLHYVSRRAMDIQGIGEGLVDVLVDNLHVREPADIYRLPKLAWNWIAKGDPEASFKQLFWRGGSQAAAHLYYVTLQQLATHKIDESSPLGDLMLIFPRLTNEVREQLEKLALSAIPKAVKSDNFADLLGDNSEGQTDLFASPNLRSNVDIYRGARGARLGVRDAMHLIGQIEKSKSVSLERFIFALGIRMVGEEVAKIVAQKVRTVSTLLSEDWSSVAVEKVRIQKENERRKRKSEPMLDDPMRGVGAKILYSLGQFVAESKNVAAVRALVEAGLDPVVKATSTIDQAGMPLAGMRILITGSIAGMTRDAVEELARSRGAEIASSISKGLRFLVVGHDPGKSKLDKAETLGIELMTADEFLRLLNG